ncbi:MAG TPA: chromate transporter [Stellaceae bacterium]|nr:chromate transporter [Stellaceae bacterium]
MDDVRPTVAEVTLAGLFLAFLRLGCTSFGGGTGSWVYREMVQRRGWIDERAFLAEMALGQSLPGANGIKMSVLVGRRLKGGVGAVAAPFGLLLGPFVIILLVGAAYARIADYHAVHVVLDGVAAAVVGLSFATGISALGKGAADPASIAVAVATVFCVGVLGWPMLPVMLGLAPVSIGLAWARLSR